MSKWEGGKVVFTEEETKELEAIIEGWFVNPSEDWIDYKGLSYEELETRLSRSSQVATVVQLLSRVLLKQLIHVKNNKEIQI